MIYKKLQIIYNCALLGQIGCPYLSQMDVKLKILSQSRYVIPKAVAICLKFLKLLLFVSNGCLNLKYYLKVDRYIIPK